MINETVCDSLRNITNCYLYVGEKVWPAYPRGGIFILSILIIILIILFAKYIVNKVNDSNEQ
jgi:hypothetical protein